MRPGTKNCNIECPGLALVGEAATDAHTIFRAKNPELYQISIIFRALNV